MKVIIVGNYEEMSKRAANIIVSQILNKPNSILGLATGSTPLEVYKILISKNLDWSKVTTFNLDEYIGVSGSQESSYFYYMHKNLFNHININKKLCHIPSGINDPNIESIQYEKLIKKSGGIDLQLLGIGENAHIGFNEPGSSFDGKTSEVNLTKSTIEANSRLFNNLSDVPKTAISMGMSTIFSAKKIILLASGVQKANAIRATIQGEVTTSVPASLLQHHPDVTIIIDKSAASKLKK